MLRRRLGPVGRLACQAAWDCQQAGGPGPVIFASRYGDADRSLALLGNHAAGQAVSPTDFALSVHNAIGAVYSIARQDGSNYSTITAGAASCASALVEADGLLHDGASSVLVVCYEAPLPGAYGVFAGEPQASYAWAWQVERPVAGQSRIRLSSAAGGSEESAGAASLPFGLDAMRFVLSGDSHMCREAQGTFWTWLRDG
jgi:hypothetical protein